MLENLYILLLAILSLLTLFFALLAVFAKNLIFSLFNLIFYFISGIWFFAFFRAEYCMVLFIIVYLGAIVVFFLFVLMLIDKQYWLLHSNLKTNVVFSFYYFSFFLFFVFIFFFLCFIFFFISSNFLLSSNTYFIYPSVDLVAQSALNLTNTEKIGLVLYSEFSLVLLVGGVILLISILGCVAIINPSAKDPLKRLS